MVSLAKLYKFIHKTEDKEQLIFDKNNRFAEHCPNFYLLMISFSLFVCIFFYSGHYYYPKQLLSALINTILQEKNL